MKSNKILKLSIYGLCVLFLIFGCYVFKYSYSSNFSYLNSSNTSIIQNRIVDQKKLMLQSNTVCSSISDKSLCVEGLSGNVYISNKNSDKWAILIHGYTSCGNSIYSSFGAIYEALGYNVLAPDLRGHGNSAGSVSFGYLESLDIYDWIKDLNSNWNRYGVNVSPGTIIVHGHSLGAATTLQLATNPDIAAAASNPYTKNLTQLKVKGFIEEAGFTSLIGLYKDSSYTNSSTIINSFIDSIAAEYVFEQYNYNFGLTVNNFSKYSNVFSNGRIFPAGSKIMAIHGTQDNIVPVANIDRLVDNVTPGILVYTWKPNDVVHSALNNDYNKLKYAGLISNFTKCVENSNCKSINWY